MNLTTGQTHGFTLSELPGEHGIQISGSIDLTPVTEQSRSYLSHNAVPIEITHDDIEQCASDKFLTKAVYLPNANHASRALIGIETLVSTRLDAGVDPIAEARRRGKLIAVIRFRKQGSKNSDDVVPVD